jgi:hypothetical protein
MGIELNIWEHAKVNITIIIIIVNIVVIDIIKYWSHDIQVLNRSCAT